MFKKLGKNKLSRVKLVKLSDDNNIVYDGYMMVLSADFIRYAFGKVYVSSEKKAFIEETDINSKYKYYDSLTDFRKDIKLGNASSDEVIAMYKEDVSLVKKRR